MVQGERLILREPNKEDEEQILEIVSEFKKNLEQSIPGSSGIEGYISFDEWLTKIKYASQKETVTAGRVVSTQFVSVRICDNKIVGFVNLRHELNDYLLKFGGHIGASIRPSERNKGYGTEQIKLCVKHCNDLGISDILITCKDWNIASKTSIMNAGGKFENTEVDPDGNILERYWIRRENEYINK